MFAFLEFYWGLLFFVPIASLGAVWHYRRDGKRLHAKLAKKTMALDQALKEIRRQTNRVNRLEQTSFLDNVTDLPQRPLLMEHIRKEIEYTRNSREYGAVIMLDIDAFRKINQTHGLNTGDAILRAISRRMKTEIGTHDLVSRTNGDEFTILLTRVGNNEAAAIKNVHRTASRLHAAITSKAFWIADQNIFLRLSMGITMLQPDGPEMDSVLEEADMALAKVQENGGNQFLFFNLNIQQQIERELTLERDLIIAVNKKQLELFLQSQFDRNGQLIGAELLSRWHHPTWGPVAPSEFIPILEATGWMASYTYWMLEQVCQLAESLDGKFENMSLSINISPQCLLMDDFVSSVLDILKRHDGVATRLVFEITEQAWLDDLATAVKRMARLRQVGIRFSVDDFGTGYTNLTYLKFLPVSELKIDRSQIQGLPRDPDSRAIVCMILALAHQLGLHVIAEGIENEQQAAFLFQHDCDAIQGYLKARPEPISDWLNSINRLDLVAL